MHYHYCPLCSNSLAVDRQSGRSRPHCPECGFVHYQNPTTGVAVIIMQKGRLLLVKRHGSYDGMWCIPCGHVEFDEDIQSAACREFKEETYQKLRERYTIVIEEPLLQGNDNKISTRNK